jgi:drug/metabolite transporter (DMT)-like permease
MMKAPSASILWMLLAAFASATLAALAHALGPYVGWQGVLLARTLFGFLLALGAARAAAAPIVLAGPRTLWLRSLAGGVGILLNFYAYTRLPVGDALVLAQTGPLWFALYASRSLGHAPSRGEWVALGSGIAGVALVGRPHLAEGNLAVLAALGSGVTSAIALRALSRLRHTYGPLTILVHHAGTAFLTAALLTALVGGRPSLGGLGAGRAGVGLLGLGLLGTLGQYAQTRALASGRAVRAAAASYAGVGFGVVLDHLLWPAPFDPASLAGMALILAPLSWLLRPAVDRIVVHRSGAPAAPIGAPAIDAGAIERALGEARRATSCVLRVHVGAPAEGEVSVAAAARFAALGLGGTARRNGALLYLGGRVALAVDHGITEIVPAPALEALCRATERDLAAGDAVEAGEAAARAVAALGRLLGDYFPARDEETG